MLGHPRLLPRAVVRRMVRSIPILLSAARLPLDGDPWLCAPASRQVSLCRGLRLYHAMPRNVYDPQHALHKPTSAITLHLRANMKPTPSLVCGLALLPLGPLSPPARHSTRSQSRQEIDLLSLIFGRLCKTFTSTKSKAFAGLEDVPNPRDTLPIGRQPPTTVRSRKTSSGTGPCRNSSRPLRDRAQ